MPTSEAEYQQQITALQERLQLQELIADISAILVNLPSSEVIVYRWVYPVQAIIVATILAIIPYLMFRGMVTWIARRFQRPMTKPLGSTAAPAAQEET